MDFSENARRDVIKFQHTSPRACFENSANVNLELTLFVEKKFSTVFKKFYEFLKNFSTDLKFVEKSLSNCFQQSGLC